MLTKRSLHISLLFLLGFALQSSAQPQNLPEPQVKYIGTNDYQKNGKEWTTYKLEVVNGSDYHMELFTPSPDLPPCGQNETASRIWLRVYNKANNKVLNTFCALKNQKSLLNISFTLEKGLLPPKEIFVSITDRLQNTQATSKDIKITAAPVIMSTPGVLQAMTDLSMREALYYTGSKTDKIDLKNDKLVINGGTMELKTSDATNCDGNSCEFNIGFIAFRSGSVNNELSTYGLLQVENGGLVGNTVFFSANEKSKEGILPLKLKMGMNKVTFTIDPYNKTAESNESNNSFIVNFKVTASPNVSGKQ